MRQLSQYARLRKLSDRFHDLFAFQGRFGFAELLITLLAFITAPVSANLIAQAALHLRLRSLSGEVPEAIERPLPWDRYKIGQRFSQNKPPMEPPKE